MNKRLSTLFLISVFLLLPGFSTAAERIYNVLFVQSYAPETPWHNDLVRGLKDGFGESGLKVNITTEHQGKGDLQKCAGAAAGR